MHRSHRLHSAHFALAIWALALLSIGVIKGKFALAMSIVLFSLLGLYFALRLTRKRADWYVQGTTFHFQAEAQPCWSVNELDIQSYHLRHTLFGQEMLELQTYRGERFRLPLSSLPASRQWQLIDYCEHNFGS